MFAGNFAHFGKVIGTKCGDPVGEASEQRRKARVNDFKFAEQALSGLFACVRADCCVNIRAKNFGFFDRLVHRIDYLVGDFAFLL